MVLALEGMDAPERTRSAFGQDYSADHGPHHRQQVAPTLPDAPVLQVCWTLQSFLELPRHPRLLWLAELESIALDDLSAHSPCQAAGQPPHRLVQALSS